MCLLDMEVNTLSKVLFLLMILLSASITFLNGLHGQYWMFFFRSILLLSSIIPISLRVNLDLAKLYYSFMINTDDSIEGTLARNSNIPEDLGRLSYLITDKTGTLTQNEMLLKKIATEQAMFDTEDPDLNFEKILNENCEKFPQGPCNDEMSASRDGDQINSGVSGAVEGSRRKKKKRDIGNNVRDLITAFAICNNVTPVMDDPDIVKALDIQREQRKSMDNQFSKLDLGSSIPKRHGTMAVSAETKMILQASSPDEIALVKYANSIGMELVERDRTSVQLKNRKGIYENYDIIANFPFSSQTKKMSVLVKHRETGKIIYYAKGAEIVMQIMIRSSQHAAALEFTDQLAMEGLRTLVFA